MTAAPIFTKIIAETNKIESLIKEDLLVYFGCIDSRIYGTKHEQKIDNKDSELILQMLIEREPRSENLCVLIQSAGGKIAEAFKITSYLKKQYRQVNFVVMSEAASAATYLCLCGETLYMRETAFLSDFGPHNWLDENATTAEQITEQLQKVSFIHGQFLEQLSKGVFRNLIKNLPNLIMNLGGPCLQGHQLNGKIHGHPLLFDQMKLIDSSTVKSYHEIPAPGTDVGYATSSFTKLYDLMLKAFRQQNLAKLIVYNNKYDGTTF